MKNSKCPRCEAQFFTAYVQDDRTCPYCGYFFKLIGAEGIRRSKRIAVDTGCKIYLNNASYSTHAYDMSKHGFALEADSKIGIGVEDYLIVQLKELNIKSEGKVVWLQKNQKRMKIGVELN